MKYEVEKYDGLEDFSLWKRKMKNILIHQEIDGPLEVDFPVDLKEGKKHQVEEGMQMYRI